VRTLASFMVDGVAEESFKPRAARKQLPGDSWQLDSQAVRMTDSGDGTAGASNKIFDRPCPVFRPLRMTRYAKGTVRL